MKMKKFYALFNTFLYIGIDIGIGRLCNCHIGIGIGIGRYENQIYRWLSVSADMKKCLSVAHYIHGKVHFQGLYPLFQLLFPLNTMPKIGIKKASIKQKYDCHYYFSVPKPQECF